ncbi:TPA: hypothetical protein ACS9WW_004172 [Salmonella enterica subsp. enterica serovar Muenchen]|nr:hypothetical protein [Salmonella enterica]
MKNVGFSGGALTVQLGKSDDMLLFFKCIKVVASEVGGGNDWSLITDKLYRRYLSLEDAMSAANLMEVLRSRFASAFCDEEPWRKIIIEAKKDSLLPVTHVTLLDLFNRYFSAFSECFESAMVMHNEFKEFPGYKYEPLKIVRTDMPQNLEDHHRSLSEFDELTKEAQPFWLR